MTVVFEGVRAVSSPTRGAYSMTDVCQDAAMVTLSYQKGTACGAFTMAGAQLAQPASVIAMMAGGAGLVEARFLVGPKEAVSVAITREQAQSVQRAALVAASAPAPV